MELARQLWDSTQKKPEAWSRLIFSNGPSSTAVSCGWTVSLALLPVLLLVELTFCFMRVTLPNWCYVPAVGHQEVPNPPKKRLLFASYMCKHMGLVMTLCHSKVNVVYGEAREGGA